MSRYSELFKSAGAPWAGAAPPSAAQEKEPPFGILFVDDEPGVLSAMRRIFLEENYRLFTAPGAAEGFAVLEQEQISLVVSDHRMPGTTGA
jgi:response regulator RpfG family c-di-GMP phosphodiesterase